MTHSLDKFTKLYRLQVYLWRFCQIEIVTLFLVFDSLQSALGTKVGVPMEIVSDGDCRFISSFWQSLQNALGTKEGFSSLFYP